MIRYKKRALGDIEEIHDYIAQFDPVAAKRVVERIEHSIGRLNAFCRCLGGPEWWRAQDYSPFRAFHISSCIGSVAIRST